MRGPDHRFRTREFMGWFRASTLEQALSGIERVGQYFSLHASPPSTRGLLLVVAYSSQAPKWRLEMSCIWGYVVGRRDIETLR